MRFCGGEKRRKRGRKKKKKNLSQKQHHINSGINVGIVQEVHEDHHHIAGHFRETNGAIVDGLVILLLLFVIVIF